MFTLLLKNIFGFALCLRFRSIIFPFKMHKFIKVNRGCNHKLTVELNFSKIILKWRATFIYYSLDNGWIKCSIPLGSTQFAIWLMKQKVL